MECGKSPGSEGRRKGYFAVPRQARPVSAIPDKAAVERMSKLAALLASDHEGERAAAALLASQHLRSLGLDWGDLVQLAFQPRLPALVEFPPPRRSASGDAGCRAMVARLLAAPHLLSAWEIGFLHSLAAQARTFSLRQAAKVLEVAERVAQRGGGAR